MALIFHSTEASSLVFHQVLSLVKFNGVVFEKLISENDAIRVGKHQNCSLKCCFAIEKSSWTWPRTGISCADATLNLLTSEGCERVAVVADEDFSSS